MLTADDKGFTLIHADVELPSSIFHIPSSKMETIAKVTATEAALKLINYLKTQHGELMFHQSGGCCDGSSPMCFPDGELIVGEGDVLLGEIGGCPFYIAAQQYKYWQHTQLIIDVASGPGGSDFSLEGPDGERFITRSRLFVNAD
ncbi:DUF779 domain-containing protein [Microcoleus sp. Pol17_C1]|uniref:DUF779 domain-containing protein n=1 Tax=unclassified Microcoleus TaxID=2642155 RepID=UPI002FD559B0